MDMDSLKKRGKIQIRQNKAIFRSVAKEFCALFPYVYVINIAWKYILNALLNALG